ncbi:telomere repeats-binding bouquet formation protein 2 [Sphaeramia orbicularis]|uniref:telomere repeats-binding bouquet formation protein 2 n=1 Tax=Sphaeramia orbicularis TaxID=375764 RepID=UPI0011816670|nr:telomere repeats-binding bouquet formation protein 2 [Sphaeramia orbicularis]
MFRNKTAWFSSSAPQECHSFWLLEGGTIADWRTADYLFSDDASCSDTLRIFFSRDYLWSKVTIFHSLFLFACEKRRSVKSVCIGHYVLPPVSVQNELRNAFGRLIWENEDEPLVPRNLQTEDELSEADVSRSSFESSETGMSESDAILCGAFQDYPVSNMLTGYVSMDSLQKYSDNLCDFHAECFRCSICSTHCCLPQT